MGIRQIPWQGPAVVAPNSACDRFLFLIGQMRHVLERSRVYFLQDLRIRAHTFSHRHAEHGDIPVGRVDPVYLRGSADAVGQVSRELVYCLAMGGGFCQHHRVVEILHAKGIVIFLQLARA